MAERPLLHFKNPRAKYVVLISYSSNVDCVHGQPQFRLSRHSQFVTEVARGMVNSGYVERVLVVGETTFGKHYPITTTRLMQQELTTGERSIDPSRIDLIDGMNSTPFQINAIRRFAKQYSLSNEDLLLVDLSFHDRRVKQYIKGFRVDFPTVAAETVADIFAPGLSLPDIPSEYLRREKKLQLLSRFDRRGIIPSVLTRIRGGLTQDGMIFDLNPDGSLEKIRGSKKLRRVCTMKQH